MTEMEKGFTGAEFQQTQKEGWEKQYQYKVGRKKNIWPPQLQKRMRRKVCPMMSADSVDTWIRSGG